MDTFTFRTEFLKYITGTPQTSFKRQYPPRYTPYVLRYATKDYCVEHAEFNCGSTPIFHEVQYLNKNTSEFIITTLDDNWNPILQEFFIDCDNTQNNQQTQNTNRTQHREYYPSMISVGPDNSIEYQFHKNGINITEIYNEVGSALANTPEWLSWEMTWDLL